MNKIIIDGDVHISPTLENGNSISIEELLKRMDKAGVDKALTWLQPPYLRHIDNANEYIYKAMKEHPDKIIGYGWADPRLGVEQAKDMVKKCIYEYGMYGVKLNGAQNDFYIDDPKISLPVIEEIAKTGKTIAFHIGGDAYESTHPYRLGKIAKMYPELTIFMVHMGGAAFADLSNAAIEVAKENQNITLIGSAIRSIPILKAIKTLGADRVCFGSDTPFELMHVEVAKYKALLEDELSIDERELVMGGNISRLLDI